MKSDIEIAREATPRPITAIAAALGIPEERVEPYGKFIAKVRPDETSAQKGKLILVTAINPTPAGEGKTTVSIGLADALRKIGKKSVLALREPSLGPVFGVKGGAAGGGYSQVIPMEEINLHFTGDLHAVTSANNLLAAMIDNHIQQGNELGIDPRRITFRRCMDMNDRQLRSITCGLGGKANGMPREDGFDITAASEVMAVFCLCRDLRDLRARLGNIIIGHSFSGEPVRAAQLHANGAMAALLQKAIYPNLVQTLEGTPAFVHGGPFANIAHGCNSVIATKTALQYGDYAVTEAGFGADLGAEKFLDIKCRMTGLAPNAVVIVATIRALKYHGGVARADLGGENLDALASGLQNLDRHIKNITENFKVPAVVAINRFVSDTEAEIALITEHCRALGVSVCLSEAWGKGGEGAVSLAQEVVALAETESTLHFTYENNIPLQEKITTLARRIYGAEGVSFDPPAAAALAEINALGDFPVCVAKTQYSFSDDPKLLGAPEGFALRIRNAKLSAGAGFVVAYAGDIITMPGLPKKAAAESIDIDGTNAITGLF
ncbi:MAG: formate--tetrahydrofolate ligase [Oscillospiraceae bacterium]|jgi:formate--tetrahydrofolate ligase|nr:formate--tetrahydrofolate ligase [Oscillospiraceae bacterium]